MYVAPFQDLMMDKRPIIKVLYGIGWRVTPENEPLFIQNSTKVIIFKRDYVRDSFKKEEWKSAMGECRIKIIQFYSRKSYKINLVILKF